MKDREALVNKYYNVILNALIARERGESKTFHKVTDDIIIKEGIEFWELNEVIHEVEERHPYKFLNPLDYARKKEAERVEREKEVSRLRANYVRNAHRFSGPDYEGRINTESNGIDY